MDSEVIHQSQKARRLSNMGLGDASASKNDDDDDDDDKDANTLV